MGTAAWSTSDEGYLKAYQWSGSLAAGATLPPAATTLPLGPGETAHLHLAPVNVFGFFGEQKEYRRSFLLVGGPVGLALTGAASYAHNQSQKAAAQRAAVPRWHPLGYADLVMTNQRLALTLKGQIESFWYAETGPVSSCVGTAGIPAVQVQPAGMPNLRLESADAPVLYVFVHHLLDGRTPGVPLPPGLLDRARAQGRLRA